MIIMAATQAAVEVAKAAILAMTEAKESGKTIEVLGMKWQWRE